MESTAIGVSAKRKYKKSSLAKRNVQKFLRNRLAILGLCMIVAMAFLCAFAPLLTQYQPNEMSLAEITKAPSAKHLFGTDKLGRDVFARVLYGGRISIFIGLSGALGGMILGVIFGSLAGYIGGVFDGVLVKIAELVSSVPQALLVLVLVVVAGQGMQNLLYVFIGTGWIATFRLTRGRFFSLREESFVEACRAFGISTGSIVFRHILPNCLGPVVVQLTLNTAGFILQEAALSFLGLGVPSNTVTWGNIMNAAREIIVIYKYPWMWLPAGIAVAVFVLGVNFFGDGLRDVFDPNQL